MVSVETSSRCSQSRHLITRSVCVAQQDAEQEVECNCGRASGSESEAQRGRVCGEPDGMGHGATCSKPFPLRLISLGADLFEAGLPRGQVPGSLLGDCLCLFQQTLPV